MLSKNLQHRLRIGDKISFHPTFEGIIPYTKQNVNTFLKKRREKMKKATRTPKKTPKTAPKTGKRKLTHKKSTTPRTKATAPKTARKSTSKGGTKVVKIYI